MRDSQKNLRLLLKFLEDLLQQEGNEWFHDELALLFSKKIITEKDNGIKLSAITLKQYGSIDSYLETGLIPIIDYSSISEPKTRFQLERDAIEMGKCRISNFHKNISFREFCKYAHFQCEELVNYFFHKKSGGDISTAKKIIKNYNYKFIDQYGAYEKPYPSVGSIPHSMKQYALTNFLGFEKLYIYVLTNISKVRNLEIHKDSNRDIDEGLNFFLSSEDFNQIYESLIYMRDKIVTHAY